MKGKFNKSGKAGIMPAFFFYGYYRILCRVPPVPPSSRNLLQSKGKRFVLKTTIFTKSAFFINHEDPLDLK
ncbi:hypothetical protein AS888_00725 [Peribacillus simplex]|uniref:Uncharacterized protein n=1 Tax=Peribacillus simplex TaxID=1478 RepID=A0A109MUC9_9BACI|nr:hypothetical protein AS888_00725 [Peribacillus simplex]